MTKTIKAMRNVRMGKLEWAAVVTIFGVSLSYLGLLPAFEVRTEESMYVERLEGSLFW